MRYIVTKRFKDKCICGYVNLPYGAVCEEENGVIKKGDKLLVFVKSENAHTFFSRDDDGHGEERGKLTHEIMKRLEGLPWDAPEWERVWDDLELRKFKRVENVDHWLWNHDFFNAGIEDLQHVLRVVKGDKK